MEKEEKSDRVPPEVLIRFSLEESISALRQNLPIPEEVALLAFSQKRMLSGLLDMLYEKLSNEDFNDSVQKARLTAKEHEVLSIKLEEPEPSCKQVGERLGKSEGTVRATLSVVQRKLDRIESHFDKEIGEHSAYAAKVVNALAKGVVEIRRLYEEDPSQFVVPKDFKVRVKEAYEIEKTLGPRQRDFIAIFEKIIEEPVVGLYIQLNSFIWEQRIYRRYLRSRFGMKQKLLQRLVFKQTRAAQAERNSFQRWVRKNGRSRGVPDFYDIQATYRLWRRELSGENALFCLARDMFVRAHALQKAWESYIFISFNSLYEKHGGPGFPLKEFSSDILQRMKPVLKDFNLIMRTTELELRREFSLDYEEELVNLTVWAARNINLSLNRGAAQALSIEGKPILDAKLEKLPANILLALAERDKGGIEDVRKILPRIAEMLRDEQPLDAKHEALRRGRSRKVAKKENTDTTLEENPEGQIVKPEDLAERQAEDFVLREEARIDLEKVIKRAKLTPSEWEVLELDLRDLTDIEIAEHLGKPVGTIKPLLFKARRKLRQVGNQS